MTAPDELPRKLTDQEKSFMRLIQRSPDTGEGWRQVGKMLWPAVIEFHRPELTELDCENRRIRFTAEGITIMRYAL